MLDVIGSVFAAIAMAVVLVVASTALARQLSSRIGIAAVAGAWIGIAAATAHAGVFATAAGPLALLLLFGLPLGLTATLALFVPAVRASLLAVPMRLLIGVNVLRTGGALFLFLAAAGRLAGPFPYSAGWGDIITGVLAVPVAMLAARGVGAHARAIWAWNAFGTLDLVLAVIFGVLSQNGSPIQLIHAGVGTHTIVELPWSMVPTFLVPAFLISHGIIFAQLRRLPTVRRQAPVTAIQAATL
jgi:hypothetical protein